MPEEVAGMASQSWPMWDLYYLMLMLFGLPLIS
jgi:hypothetical protein